VSPDAENTFAQRSLGDRQTRTPAFISYKSIGATSYKEKFAISPHLKEWHRGGISGEYPLHVLAGNLGAAILAPTPVLFN
jgi:hypothetical protein